VKPGGSQNQSTASKIDMAFELTVTPKSPTPDPILTAYVEIHLEGIPAPNDVRTIPITTHIPVHRTVSYTIGQIFANWTTWWAIAVAGAGGAAWILRRMPWKKQSSDA
jgi:hypothetical protein